MTNLSLKYRELLKQNYEVGAEAPVEEMRSVDGTVKYLYPVGENHFVESVYIPDDERATLCISSQVGCKMNCKFCMTGKQGYSANLTAHQIINQIHSLPERDKLTNVVMMGMGEPLDNLEEVLKALDILTGSLWLCMEPEADYRFNCRIAERIAALYRRKRLSPCHQPAFSGDRPACGTDAGGESLFYHGNGGTVKNYDFSKQRRLSFEYIVF